MVCSSKVTGDGGWGQPGPPLVQVHTVPLQASLIVKNNWYLFCGLWGIAFVPSGPGEVPLIQSDYFAADSDLFFGDSLSSRPESWAQITHGLSQKGHLSFHSHAENDIEVSLSSEAFVCACDIDLCASFPPAVKKNHKKHWDFKK